VPSDEEIRQQPRKMLFAAPAGQPFDTRSTNLFKILAANSLAAIFYGESLARPSANSRPIIDLEIQSGIFFDPDQGSENVSDGKQADPNRADDRQGTKKTQHLYLGKVRTPWRFK
jgi:hypothetical protein